jgi:ribosome maturation factor RimP
MAALPENIEAKITEIAAEHRAIVLEIVRRGHTNSSVVEVIVDAVDGVGLDRLTLISRKINDLLDEDEGVIRGRYRLEVSTPGLDRPLEHTWQFEKNIGRLVRITSLDDQGKKGTAIFRLLEVSDRHVRLQPMKAKGKGRPVQVGDPLELDRSSLEKVIVEPEL